MNRHPERHRRPCDRGAGDVRRRATQRLGRRAANPRRALGSAVLSPVGARWLDVRREHQAVYELRVRHSCAVLDALGDVQRRTGHATGPADRRPSPRRRRVIRTRQAPWVTRGVASAGQTRLVEYALLPVTGRPVVAVPVGHELECQQVVSPTCRAASHCRWCAKSQSVRRRWVDTVCMDGTACCATQARSVDGISWVFQCRPSEGQTT